MNKIKDVPFSDFVELVQFLKFNDEETEYHNITKRLTRFIEGMNAYHSVLIDNIVKDILDDKTEDAEQLFNTFNENFGDLNFDPEGRLDLTDFNYFEISHQSIDMLFEQAKERIKEDIADDIDRQVYNAKTLEPLLKLNGRFEYPIKKFMYFKNNVYRPVTKEQLKITEEQIAEMLPEGNNVMGKFMEYIFHKKPERISTFIDHFLHRVDVLYRDEDVTHPSNKEFYELLKQL